MKSIKRGNSDDEWREIGALISSRHLQLVHATRMNSLAVNVTVCQGSPRVVYTVGSKFRSAALDVTLKASRSEDSSVPACFFLSIILGRPNSSRRFPPPLR